MVADGEPWPTASKTKAAASGAVYIVQAISEEERRPSMNDQQAWYDRFATAMALLPMVIVIALLFLLLVGIVFLYD